MLSFLHLLFIFITNDLFVKCSENHKLIIQGTNNKEKQLIFYLYKCTFQNKERCNEFITSAKKLTGDLEYEYNGDDNLCMILRELYADEKHINWEDVKSHIKKGATSKKIAEMCAPLGTSGKNRDDDNRNFEVPLVWKHGKIGSREEIKQFLKSKTMHTFDSSELFPFLQCFIKDDLSSNEDAINPCLEGEEVRPIDLRGLFWYFNYENDLRKNSHYSGQGETSSSSSNEETTTVVLNKKDKK